MEQVAQRSCGCPFPGHVQGQAGRGFEQHAVVESVPLHSKGVGIRSSSWSLRA